MQIKLENISYRYKKQMPWILKDLNFKMNSKEKIALVGASGSGKSTLAKIISGYIRPNKGKVLFGDSELGEELQRFCIARAIGPKTKFLICDEISTMLDVITQAQIWNLLLDISKKRNIGMLIVTHNIELAKRVIWIMDSSKLVNSIGKFPLPVEVLPYGYTHVIKKLLK